MKSMTEPYDEQPYFKNIYKSVRENWWNVSAVIYLELTARRKDQIICSLLLESDGDYFQRHCVGNLFYTFNDNEWVCKSSVRPDWHQSDVGGNYVWDYGKNWKVNRREQVETSPLYISFLRQIKCSPKRAGDILMVQPYYNWRWRLCTEPCLRYWRHLVDAEV